MNTAGDGVYQVTLPPVARDQVYRVRGGDALSRLYDVRVRVRRRWSN
jgi:hypothetical protein